MFDRGHKFSHALHVKNTLVWFFYALVYATHGAGRLLDLLTRYIDVSLTVLDSCLILPLLDKKLLEPILHVVMPDHRTPFRRMILRCDPRILIWALATWTAVPIFRGAAWVNFDKATGLLSSSDIERRSVIMHVSAIKINFFMLWVLRWSWIRCWPPVVIIQGVCLILWLSSLIDREWLQVGRGRDTDIQEYFCI